MRLTAATADDTRALGERLARLLRPGDLLVLSGDLGAGKTTLTQGLGAGLGVRGDVTSPTFVISRVHPPLGDGPALVHVDAYRLGGLAELDDLDLDTSLEEAVTVVEWGVGLAEGLAEDRLELEILRPHGGTPPDETPPDETQPDDTRPDDTGPDDTGPGGSETRTLRLTPVGSRWADVDLSVLSAASASRAGK